MAVQDLDLIRITDTYLLLNGAPAEGDVTFTANVVLHNTAANEMVFPRPFVGTLDATGLLDVTLPATDDPDLSPTGWTYTVTEKITGSATRTRQIEVPFDSPLEGGVKTLHLSDVIPVSASEGVANYVLVTTFNEALSDLETIEGAQTKADAVARAVSEESAPFGASVFDVARVRAEHADPLVIPTFDGSGQTVHPDVWVFPRPWNGYRYWMAFTPYPDGDATVENPSIVASHDGVTWVVPAGLVNPIDAPAIQGNFYPDPCLMVVGDALWCIYASDKGKFSTDGVTWSARQQLNVPSGHLSPTVQEYDGVYHLWLVNSGVNPNVMSLYRGDDILTYGAATPCVLNGGPPGRDIWHIAVRRVSGGWVGTFAYVDLNVSGANTALHLATSADGVTWDVGVEPLLAPDAGTAAFDRDAYRGCFVPSDGRGGVAGRLWYSGSNRLGQWATALTLVHAVEPAGYPEFARADRAEIVRSTTVLGGNRNKANNPTLLIPNPAYTIAPLGFGDNMVGASGHRWEPETQSWTLLCGGSGTGNISQNRTDLDMTTGTWWTWSCEGKAEAVAGAGWQLQILFYDAANAVLASPLSPWSHNLDDFVRLSVSGQAPAGTTRMLFLLRANGATRRWFRRIQMERSQLLSPWESGASSTIILPEVPTGAALEVLGPLTAAGAPPRGAITKQGAVALPKFTSALRPSAAAVGEGATIYDDTLNLPIFSDGASWKNYAGAAV